MGHSRLKLKTSRAIVEATDIADLKLNTSRAIVEATFINCEGQSHIKAVSTNHNLFEEKGKPKRIRTEVPRLTSLTPYR